jgi:hypothetical protein
MNYASGPHRGYFLRPFRVVGTKGGVSRRLHHELVGRWRDPVRGADLSPTHAIAARQLHLPRLRSEQCLHSVEEPH